MIPADDANFVRALLILGEAFGEQISETRIEAYRLVLEAYDIAAIEQATRKAMSTLKFFPKPAEIIEIIEGGSNDRAAMAWAAFLDATSDSGYASVKFLEPATAIAVDAVFGGWIQACELLHTCAPEMLAHYLNNFSKQYTAARNANRDVVTYRAGRSELSMRDGGQWKERMQRAVVQPVLLVGQRETRKVMLPFDPQAGTLRADAMEALLTGVAEVLKFAQQFSKPALAAAKETRALKAAPEPMATKEEVEAILAEAKAKHGDSPYLKALEVAA